MKRKSKITFLTVGILAVLAVVLYSCGGGSSSAPPMTTSTVQVVPCSSVTPAVTVSATEYMFTSSAVHAPVGGVVKWTNNGMMQSVTSGSPPGTFDGMFDQTLNPTQSVCLKFTTAGTYNYYCKFHYTLGMVGSVTVP